MSEKHAATTLLRRLYRVILYGYDGKYRTAFGPEMEQTFLTVCAQSWERGGVTAVLRTVAAELFDTVRVALQQRLQSWAARLGKLGKGSQYSPRNSSGSPIRGSRSEPLAQALADVRHAIRSLAKRPGYSTVAIATIAIGVGASTAIFSVVDTVMMRPLPYRDPDGLFDLWNYIPAKDLMYAAHPIDNARTWREQEQIFEQVEVQDIESFVSGGEGDPELISGSYISVGLIPMLGISPQIGRAFVPEESEPGAGRVVILSDGLWKRRFGGDPSAIGEALLLAESIAQPRFMLLLVTTFAIIAVTLAVIGMYGVISYSVSQRERELGIRMALGAPRVAVRRMVLKQGMLLAVVGTAVGLVGASGMTKFLDTLLFEVEPTDPLTFGAVAAGLLAAALLACYVPAQRATRVDPMVALRSE